MAAQDPREALNKAKGLVEGKGILGWITRLFMGKQFTQTMSSTIGQAEGHLDTMEMQRRVLASGAPGTAVVQKIEDTGALINFNPVVKLTLKVQPADAPAFEATITTPVSKIAVPRVNDVLQVRYNPSNRNEIAIVPG